MTSHQIIFLVILSTSFFLLVTEKLRNDLVAILIVFSLYATGILSSKEALAGFSNEAAIVLAGIFVLGGALHATGVSAALGQMIGKLAGGTYSRIILVVMPAVAVVAAFTHHVTTTAVMVPIVSNIAKERGIAPSKLLMPLAVAASLGTTITIIGAPAFLLASSVLKEHGSVGLSVFSIAPIGILLSIIGTLYFLSIGRFLLPVRPSGAEQAERYRLDDYLTEVIILENSPLSGKTIEEMEDKNTYSFSILNWRRHRKKRSERNVPLSAGDVLLVRTTPEAMSTVRQESGIELHAIHRYGSSRANTQNADDREESYRLMQAVVAHRSELIWKTLASTDLFSRYNVVVVGIWRKKGWLGNELSKVRLRSGDVLVLEGDDEALEQISHDNAFLMFVPFQGESQLKSKAPLASAIMAASVVAAAFEWLSTEMAALAGAVAVVLTRCITAKQAYAAIDARIFIFIAGAIPLGSAMQKTGLAEMAAIALKRDVDGWPVFGILLLLFGVVAALTQFMSDAATTALFAPVAASLAISLGLRPEAFVVTVAMASVTAFLTPIGHHGNLLIYTPGGYKFSDFVRVGGPLTILIAGLVAWVAPLLWPS